MEFRETLLAAQRNQQEKSSASSYYKARFDPPKKEQKQRDKLSANIQKFLAKKDEEEKQKKIDAQRKRDELIAMRDPKALRKIQKTLKVIKSANKSVLEDAVDRDNTAITMVGPDQPDQDDYGYESQEAAALYAKMMQKYSKIPDEPKFPVGNSTVKRDLNGTRERVKHALQHEEEPVPHKRRRRGGEVAEKEPSPPLKTEPEKKKDEQKSDKPKIRKPAPPPMDFNQLLKLAEQKKSVPVEVGTKKQPTDQEAERLMTKKQKREYEEEMARRQRRQERLEAEKAGSRKVHKEDRPVEKDKKSDPGFGRIPKLGDKSSANHRNSSPKSSDKDRQERERAGKINHRNSSPKSSDKDRQERERAEKIQREKEKIRLEKEKAEQERLDKLKAERERIDRDIERLHRDRERLEKSRSKLESKSLTLEKSSKPVDKTVDKPKLNPREQSGRQDTKKNIDLKSQNTYRIDKNNDRKLPIPSKNSDGKYVNGHSSHERPVPKPNREQLQQRNDMKDKLIMKQKLLSQNEKSPKPSGKLENSKYLSEGSKISSKRPDDRGIPGGVKSQPSSSKGSFTNTFDFDKHFNSLKNPNVNRKSRPDERRIQKRRALDSDSEYDSEMDDFIDDGDENMDYSRHIKEIFGYDKSKYRDVDDDDDPAMESSFAVQQREEYISKKIGIMEDLEDMKMEAMEKKRNKKKGRRISDD